MINIHAILARKRHKKQKKHKRLKHRERSRSASREKRLVAAAPTEVQAWIRHQQQPRPEDDNLDASGRKLFEFDCAGDRDNRFYGTLYAQDKPLYALATRRNLLTGEWISNAKASSGGDAAKGGPAARNERDVAAERYFSASARQAEKDAKQTRLHLAYSEKRLARQREQQSGAASELPFIPLDPVIDTAGSAVSEELALQTETASIEQYLVVQSKTFNESLQQHPHDVACWLNYVAFQEHSARLARRKSSSNSHASAQMVADKQVAILDKAIQANPASRELRLARLNLAMQRGSSSAPDFDARWRQLEEMIESDPTSAALWTKLIRARQQNFASFSVPSLRELYARILAVLRREVALVVQHEAAEAPSSGGSHTGGSVQIFDADSLLASSSRAPRSYASVLASSERAHELVQLLLTFQFMACTLELKAGYAERAIAQLQALLAFNAAPSSSAMSVTNPTPEQLHAEMLRTFAERWSQGLPHYGDEFHSSLRLPNDEQVETAESGLMYSNVHGYRIKIDTIDDAGEYERILAELRGTDASVARQEAQLKKREKQRASATKSVARFHDERVDYDEVDSQDEYVEWLQQEEAKHETQWNPLQPTNPEHQQLIDESPDRAVLTEEIQPFLFQVPRVLHLQIVLILLQCVGVRWTGNQANSYPETLMDVYADGFDELGDLVAPILRAMDPSSTEPIGLSTLARRDLLQRELLDELRVNTETLLDPSRVAFVRNALLRLMNSALHEGDRESERLAKYLTIEFEAEIVGSSEEERDAGLSYARELCQTLMEGGDHEMRESSPNIDIALMFAYAKLELRAGNHRVVNRICDKTIESLALHSTDVKAAVVEKYRVELEIAVQQQSKQDKRNTGVGVRQSQWLTRVGYCAHNLCLIVYAVAGFHASCSEYRALIREFIQQHQLSCSFPIVAPRDWRHVVGDAVERFPHDPVLLRLFVDAETSSTMSQRLRQHFSRTQQRWRRQFDSPLLVEWLFALLCEFARLERFALKAFTDSGIAGGTPPTQLQSTCCLLHKYQSNVVGFERVRRVFQDMVEGVRTRDNALCWRLYVRFEEQLGKVESARRVFYRGLARCPWSKALYLDGIRVLRPYLSEDECRELVDFMGAKELHLREEALKAACEETAKQAIAATTASGQATRVHHKNAKFGSRKEAMAAKIEAAKAKREAKESS
ncbi:hypothetical protein PybrP1_004338 [[Pythium] brassicae (nom. inval.)]|nr:hypothetical protein PybrP1_004338 [[Pythium] brassicae (nom. inval.)]